MTEKEVEKVLDELNNVRPEKLNAEAKRLFEAIMKIADERDKAQADLYEANIRIDDLLDINQHWIDKIKAKIEEVDRKIYEYKKWKELGAETDVEYYDYIGMEIARDFLQSLLEEKE